MLPRVKDCSSTKMATTVSHWLGSTSGITWSKGALSPCKHQMALIRLFRSLADTDLRSVSGLLGTDPLVCKQTNRTSPTCSFIGFSLLLFFSFFKKSFKAERGHWVHQRACNTQPPAHNILTTRHKPIAFPICCLLCCFRLDLENQGSDFKHLLSVPEAGVAPGKARPAFAKAGAKTAFPLAALPKLSYTVCQWSTDFPLQSPINQFSWRSPARRG